MCGFDMDGFTCSGDGVVFKEFVEKMIACAQTTASCSCDTVSDFWAAAMFVLQLQDVDNVMSHLDNWVQNNIEQEDKHILYMVCFEAAGVYDMQNPSAIMSTAINAFTPEVCANINLEITEKLAVLLNADGNSVPNTTSPSTVTTTPSTTTTTTAPTTSTSTNIPIDTSTSTSTAPAAPAFSTNPDTSMKSTIQINDEFPRESASGHRQNLPAGRFATGLLLIVLSLGLLTIL